ncbi:hypothetical protein KEM54_006236 [Ascosphaera aggregata]|nr:hypothetical protein KEM54_006236 [Ascosphaera aggregata]
MGDSIQVGDAVRLPGGMQGTVRFVGAVDGKPGRFAGIELDATFAGKGRNNGDFNGRQYFETSSELSGLFAPLNGSKLITKLTSTSPATPSAKSGYSKPNNLGLAPPSSLSASLRRMSLNRPASPASSASSKIGFNSLRSKGLNGLKGPSAANGGHSRPGLRISSHPPSQLNGGSPAPSPLHPPTMPAPLMRNEITPSPQPPSLSSSPIYEENETSSELAQRLRYLEQELEERDRQLEEQTSMLEELQESITELEGLDIMQVRAQLREKTDKIAQLTQEFDNDRADFRSTLDTLEIAAAETERVYERRVEELMQANHELQERGEDVGTVARQLKQLEELVSELEEGLEDARRGETEAKGEVEFLRGEVERTKLELKQERDKSAAALRAAEEKAASLANQNPNAKELEQKEEQIRGLKAIIDSLNGGAFVANGNHPNGDNARNEQTAELELRVQELEQLLQNRTQQVGDLERRLYAGPSHGTVPTEPLPLRPKSSTASNATTSSTKDPRQRLGHAHTSSDRTIVPGDFSELPPNLQVRPPPRLQSRPRTSTVDLENDDDSSPSGEDSLWCEICETSGHEILNCTNMFGSGVVRSFAAAAHNKQAEKPITSNSNGDGNAVEPATFYNSNMDHSKLGTPIATPQDERGSYAGMNGEFEEFPGEPNKSAHSPGSASELSGRDTVVRKMGSSSGLSTNSMGALAGKNSGVVDESKWCALCERDGHESIDCPFDE